MAKKDLTPLQRWYGRGVRRLRILGAGAAAVAVLLFAGCGSSDSTSTKSPADTLRAWLDATASGDGQTACALMIKGLQQQTAAVAGGSDCAAGIKRAGELNPAVAQFNQVKVNHVEIHGDRARVTGAVPSIKKNATFTLQRVDGKWLVSSTGG